MSTLATAAEEEVGSPPGPSSVEVGWLTTTDHKAVGRVCLALAFLFLVVGGVLGVVMRTQLARPGLELVGSHEYRQLLTAHGTFSLFLFLMPAWLGLGFAMVPLQIGAARLAFPRMAAMTAWMFAGAGVLLVVSALVRGGPLAEGLSLSAGRFRPGGLHGDSPELWVLGLFVAGLAIVLGAVNILTTVLTMRAPGMSSARTPMFTWSMVAASAVLLLATPVLLAGLVLLYVGHHYGGRVFDVRRGGDPLVWQQLFWFFAHPAMWALVLPAFGVVSEIVAVFSRRPLLRARHAAMAIGIAAALAFAGWGTHLAGDSAVPRPLFALTGLLVLAPLALVLLSWLGTLRGARPKLDVPMLHALGVISLVAAGLGGTLVLVLARSGKAGATTYWWVGAWHLLLVGGSTLGVVTAVSYWAPKLWGRHLSKQLSGLQLLLLVAGSHLSFLPMLVLGVQGMPRRTTAYDGADGWGAANLVSTAGSYLLALGVLVFLVNVAVSARRGDPAAADPWDGATLEWATASPPPPHNFDAVPEIRSDRPLADLHDEKPVAELEAAPARVG